MWFRNLAVLRVPAGSELDADALADALLPFAFTEPTSVEEVRTGFVPPREGDASLVASVGRQLLFALRQEKRLLPARVVAQFVKQRAERIEAEEGFKPGRKRMKELKEQVRDELLPRAFSLATDTRAWIDPVNGWLVIDAASAARADEVVGLLAKAFDGFPGRPLKTVQSPAAAMTQWIADGEAPAGFTIDQDVVLKARDGKATVRWANQSLEADDVARHVKAGKQCTRLARHARDQARAPARRAQGDRGRQRRVDRRRRALRVRLRADERRARGAARGRGRGARGAAARGETRRAGAAGRGPQGGLTRIPDAGADAAGVRTAASRRRRRPWCR